MDEVTLQQYNFFTTEKGGLWIVESYCMRPSCTIRNLDTDEVKSFGMGGLTAKEFEPVRMDRALEDALAKLFRKQLWKR